MVSISEADILAVSIDNLFVLELQIANEAGSSGSFMDLRHLP